MSHENHPSIDGDAPAKPTHLEPSELGTKEYWDKLYTTEITNYAHDPSDTGTNWFDDSDAQAKIIGFLEELQLDTATTSFLDLGTGNGELLFGLRDGGWEGSMLGVDYSERSIELARRICAARQTEADEEQGEGEGDKKTTTQKLDDVEFRFHDILSSPGSNLLAGQQTQGWDVVLDKGTFDAISLSSATDDAGRRVSEGYRGRVLELVKEGGFFLVTSCNWTEEELRPWFEGSRDSGRVDGADENAVFEKVGRVEYPSFSFGGVKGQTISTLCFRKVSRTT